MNITYQSESESEVVLESDDSDELEDSVSVHRSSKSTNELQQYETIELLIELTIISWFSQTVHHCQPIGEHLRILCTQEKHILRPFDFK